MLSPPYQEWIMVRILKYSFYDLLRSRWNYVYFGFYLTLGFLLFFLNNDISKAVITLMNIIVVLVPLIASIFGTIYYYNSREFTELLLSQPLKRSSIFLGQYFGVAGSLALSFVLGLGIPFLLFGLLRSAAVFDFSLLLLTGVLLTFIFTALSFNISLSNDNRIRGFGYSVLLWLFLAVIYDGLFLISLIVLEEYPLDTYSLAATLLNPIDLSRILILLKLDISALMGYTGAVFQQFFGTYIGMTLSLIMLLLWTVLPLWRMCRLSMKKDF